MRKITFARVLTVFLLLLLLQDLYLAVPVILDVDINAWIHKNVTNWKTVFEVMGYFFLFNILNMLICAFGGGLLLVQRKKIPLALLCIGASVVFFIYVRQIGDAF